MARRPGVHVVRRFGAPAGKSPNVYVGEITVDMRAFWTPETTYRSVEDAVREVHNALWSEINRAVTLNNPPAPSDISTAQMGWRSPSEMPAYDDDAKARQRLYSLSAKHNSDIMGHVVRPLIKQRDYLRAEVDQHLTTIALQRQQIADLTDRLRQTEEDNE